MKKIGLLIALVLIFCGISYAHSDQFDLVSDYSYESPLWYFGSPGNTSIGYYGYSNGSSTISFKRLLHGLQIKPLEILKRQSPFLQILQAST